MTSLLNISVWGYSAVPVLKYLLHVGWEKGSPSQHREQQNNSSLVPPLLGTSHNSETPSQNEKNENHD